MITTKLHVTDETHAKNIQYFDYYSLKKMKKKKRKRFSENTKNTEEEAKYPYIIFMLLYREEITELNKKNI